MHALLLLTVLPSAPLGEEKPKAPPKELEKLQGIWKVTALESSGRSRPPTARTADRYYLVVVGDSYVFYTHAGALAVDLDKKTVDLKAAEGPYKGQTLPGIFELTGDTLQFTYALPVRGAERPTALTTVRGSGHTVYTLERDTKATKEQAEAKLKDMKASLPTTAFDPGPGFGPAADRATQDLLKQVLEKLERIEKRLDEMEKKAKDK